MRARVAPALATAAVLAACAGPEAPPQGTLRVMSLDGCADQYLLAMAPDAELALSPRADDPDSHMRAAARGRTRVRTTLEAAVGFRPDVAVRQWGGDPRLVAALKARGVRVIEIGDADDFDEIRANVLRVAAELERPQAGVRLVQAMDRDLAAARAASGQDGGEPALYLTAAGWTAGRGTLVDAVMRAGGLETAAEAPGYGPVGLEAAALDPPRRFVLGFFDRSGSDRFGAGRHPVLAEAMRAGQATELPSSLIACPAWFTSEAALRLARG
jgi:iron complex transport system substrate-binding protein